MKMKRIGMVGSLAVAAAARRRGRPSRPRRPRRRNSAGASPADRQNRRIHRSATASANQRRSKGHYELRARARRKTEIQRSPPNGSCCRGRRTETQHRVRIRRRRRRIHGRENGRDGRNWSISDCNDAEENRIRTGLKTWCQNIGNFRGEIDRSGTRQANSATSTSTQNQVGSDLKAKTGKTIALFECGGRANSANVAPAPDADRNRRIGHRAASAKINAMHEENIAHLQGRRRQTGAGNVRRRRRKTR